MTFCSFVTVQKSPSGGVWCCQLAADHGGRHVAAISLSEKQHVDVTKLTWENPVAPALVKPGTEYVCGFLIHRPLNLVVLVRKQKPAWQAGLLNGVGGKLEALCRCGHIENEHSFADSSCSQCYAMRNMLTAPCSGFNYKEQEAPRCAMQREFKEETGVNFINWGLFCTLHGEARRSASPWLPYTVHFYRGFTVDFGLLNRIRSVTTEEIVVESIANVTAANAIPNLPWLLRAALDIDRDIASSYEVSERYRLPNE